MKVVRAAVIGCGSWGTKLSQTFAELPSSRLVAVADLSSERLAYVKARFPRVMVTDDYWDLFSTPLDMIAVATPPATHFHIARDCLHHNLPTLVEQPLALNSHDAKRLIGIADKQHLSLMVGHTFEYHPAVSALKDLIDCGQLGQVHYVDAAWVNLGVGQPDLNVLWDLAPYGLSIVLYLLGVDPVQVMAQGADCMSRGKHDVVYLNLQFSDNVMAHIRLSRLEPCQVQCVTVVGSRKMVVFDNLQNLEKIKIYDRGSDGPLGADTVDEVREHYDRGAVIIPNIPVDEPLRLECQHFVDCVISSSQPQSCGRGGLRVIRVLEASQRSLGNGSIPVSMVGGSLAGQDEESVANMSRFTVEC
jgi:predicted dehydrogenase